MIDPRKIQYPRCESLSWRCASCVKRYYFECSNCRAARPYRGDRTDSATTYWQWPPPPLDFPFPIGYLLHALHDAISRYGAETSFQRHRDDAERYRRYCQEKGIPVPDDPRTQFASYSGAMSFVPGFPPMGSNQSFPGMEAYEEQQRKQAQKKLQEATEKPLTDEIAKAKDYKGKSAPITSAVLLLQALAQQDVAAGLGKIAKALEKQGQAKPPSGKDGDSGAPSGESGSGGIWSQMFPTYSSNQIVDFFKSVGIDENETAFIGGIIDKTKETMDIWLPWKYALDSICGKKPGSPLDIQKIIQLVQAYRKYKPLIEKLTPVVLNGIKTVTASYSSPAKATESASLAEHYPEIADVVQQALSAITNPTRVFIAEPLIEPRPYTEDDRLKTPQELDPSFGVEDVQLAERAA